MALFSVLLVLKLDRVITWNWGYILIPFWITCIQASFVDGKWPEFKHKFEKNFLSNAEWIFPQLFPRNFVITLIIFTILMVLKLENVIAPLWSVIFIPWWTFLFLYLMVLMVLVQDTERSPINNCEWQWIQLFILVPLTLFFVLLVLFLDGVIHRLVFSFIPIFLLEFFGVFILPCLICCIFY